jgi:hypothetical protein
MTDDGRPDGGSRDAALIVVAAVAGLSVAWGPGLSIGPLWLFPLVVAALLVPTVISHRDGQHQADRPLALVVTTVVTLELIAPVIRLVSALPSHRQLPTALLRSASAIWVANIPVFAL